jgi:hypothetical protein
MAAPSFPQTPVVNGVATPTYQQSPSPIVIGSYAQGVQDIISGNRQLTNEDGVTENLGGIGGRRLVNGMDLWQIQLVIDAYEFVKNSNAMPGTDAAPSVPWQAQPLPPM